MSTFKLSSFRGSLQNSENSSNSKVYVDNQLTAILLTVCDDFDPAVAGSALNQKDVKTDLFILDDSKSEEIIIRIDSWAKEKSIISQVVRRNNNEGFKAGNINNWLFNFSDQSVYNHVFIIDADVVLPSDYLFNLLNNFTNSEAAFIQGCHKQKTPSNWFEYAGGLLIDSEWLGFVAARKFWGLPQILGHGVLIKTDELISIGGVPQIVSEDLALTIHLAESTKYGMVCPVAVAEEQFPTTYKRYRNRLVRWVAADVEIAGGYLKRILRSKLELSGKLDLFLRETRLPLLCLYSILLILISMKLILSNNEEILVSPYFLFLFPFIWISYLPALWLKTSSFKQRVSFLFCMPFISSSLLGEYPLCFWKGILKKVDFKPTNSVQKHKERYILWHNLYLLSYGSVLIIAGVIASLPLFVAIGISTTVSPLFTLTVFNKTISSIFVVIFWILFFVQWIPFHNFGGIQIEALFALAGLALCRD